MEEGQVPRVPTHGYKPSQEEVDKHNACHIPFRSWCPFCVAGKAKNEPHRPTEELRAGDTNVVQIDYTFLGDKVDDTGPAENVGADSDSDADSEREEDRAKDETMPVLVLRDRRHKYVTARVMPRKGSHPYAVRRLGQDIT